MNWLWQNPPPFWQWAGIAVTCIGAGLSLAAVLFARSARDQARRAAARTRRLNSLGRLESLRLDLDELNRATTRGDCEAVAMQANTLLFTIARMKPVSLDAVVEVDAHICCRQLLEELTAVTEVATIVGRKPPRAVQLQQLRNATGKIQLLAGELTALAERSLRVENET